MIEHDGGARRAACEFGDFRQLAMESPHIETQLLCAEGAHALNELRIE